MAKRRRKIRRRSRTWTVVIHILLTMAALTMVTPFWKVFVDSLKTDELLGTPTLLPTMFRWSNYKLAWYAGLMDVGMRNSLIISTLSTLPMLFFSGLAGYALAKLKFVGSRWFTIFTLTTLMLPNQVTIIPFFLLIQRLHLYDTYTALWLPIAADGFSILLLANFFRSIPRELVDAARIDGCSEFGIFWRIMFPLSLPCFATLGLFRFVSMWNSFLYPMLLLKTRSKFPLQVLLQLYLAGTPFRGETLLQQADVHLSRVVRNASIIIAVVPMLILYLLLQRYFVKGLTLGAGK